MMTMMDLQIFQLTGKDYGKHGDQGPKVPGDPDLRRVELTKKTFDDSLKQLNHDDDDDEDDDGDPDLRRVKLMKKNVMT